MAKERDHYIKVPTVQGNWKYIHVDGKRWTSLTDEARLQIHTRSKSKGGSTFSQDTGLQYHQENDAELHSVLTELIEDITGQWKDTLEMIGVSGLNFCEELLVKEQFYSLAYALSLNDSELIENSIRDLLYSLMGGSSKLAAEMENTRSHVDGMQTAVSLLTSGGEDSIQKMYFAWSESAENLHSTLETLRSLREEALLIQRQTLSKWEEMQALMSIDKGEAVAAMNFLDGDDKSFIIEATMYLREPDNSPDIEADLDTAEHIIRSLRETENTAGEAWKSFREQNGIKLLELERKATQTVGDLREASARFELCEELFGDQEKPFAVSEVAMQFTDEATYVGAQSILNDAETGPQKMKDSILSVVDACQDILNSVFELPKDMSNTLEETSDLIRQIRGLNSFDEEMDEEEDDRSAEHEVHTLEEAVMVRSISERACEDDRTLELYELMQCVGLEITCNVGASAISTIRSMLDVIQILGLMTDEERVLFKNPLKELIESENESMYIEHGVKVRPLFETCHLTWITRIQNYNGIKRRGFKLTKAAGKRAERLLEAHGLTRPMIRAAHKERYKFVVEQRKKRAS